jgi:GTP diphosphokinase / guanosine-3',5'-bis(diphosphate) 3'-diphosphatase
MSEFSELRKELRKYLPKEQIEQVHQAYLLAEKAHEKQRRSSGEPYITHPVAVAKILAGMRLDPATISAALMHDVIEDTGVTKQELTEKFSEEIAELVDGVTKLTRIHFESKAEAQAESFRKMMLAMARDIRVILIKLADRLHNMRTLGHLDANKRSRIARETLEIYAPITNRLGMYDFMIEFEDLSFEALYPQRCRVLRDSIKRARGNRKEILSVIEKSLRGCLKKAGLGKLTLFGRQKHLYSIYRKMRDKHVRFSEVMDVYAFRIIADNVDMCYRILGVVHNLYKPVPDRFKDFIAMPKSNGYQSLHTTLFGPYGVPIEIQIRTEEMEQVAVSGIAAHWIYKTSGASINKTQMRARKWIKEILEIQQSTGSSLEFIENVKVDLFPDEVYLFTPRGDIVKLPRGSTIVDFAYAVHTEVGSNCIAAKVSHRLVPLSTELKSGQTVEVITAPGARPNPSWLSFVVTGKARSGIRHFLKEQRQAESIALGKHLLEKALATANLNLKELAKPKHAELLTDLRCEQIDDLYEQVGLGNHPPQLVVERLKQQEKLPRAKKTSKAANEAMAITGTEGLVLSYAKCCYPVPGDMIEGVMTAGHGMVVHQNNCKNLAVLQSHPEKCVALRWGDQVQGEYEVSLTVELMDRQGALAMLTQVLADEGSNVKDIRIEERRADRVLDHLVVTVKDRTHLAQLLRRLHQSDDVIAVSR